MTIIFQTRPALLRIFTILTAGALLVGCGSDDDGDDADDDDNCMLPAPVFTSLEDVCALDKGPFSTTIDNPWFPLPVGRVTEFQGTDMGVVEYVRITVSAETFDVGGVTTVVVEEYETEDDVRVEESRNYFAQASDGTVCYFGEDVDMYDDTGETIIAHDGAWLAGGANRPGIIMPANPAPGMSYAQEIAPGQAEDHADHISAGDTIPVTVDTYTDTQRTREWSPLEPDSTSDKAYARGVGMIRDNLAELISITPAP